MPTLHSARSKIDGPPSLAGPLHQPFELAQKGTKSALLREAAASQRRGSLHMIVFRLTTVELPCLY